MKNKLTELAIFGAAPAFNETLHVGRPNIGNSTRLLERINDMLSRRWLTNDGPYVQEFEFQISKLIGVKHCIAMCNATVALEIAIRATNLSGEVLVPSFTFVATAHALQWQQITPVFCDVDPISHSIDPTKIERMITPRTTGIIGVHVWGNACDIDALTYIAAQHNLTLIFDAAHAFACTYRGKMIGSSGTAEVFSFHATKFINTFEGGAVVTNDDDLAQKIRYMRNFGFAGYDKVDHIGTNGKMNEVSAAMGLTSLESITDIKNTNYRNYKLYERYLKDIPGISLYKFDENENHNYQYIVVEIDEQVTHIDRDILISILHAENILARRYFYPGCHQMEPYRSYFPHAGMLLPETEKLTQRVITLPTGSTIHQDMIETICQIIQLAIEFSDDIKFTYANL